jgi:hypothetical protein
LGESRYAKDFVLDTLLDVPCRHPKGDVKRDAGHMTGIQESIQAQWIDSMLHRFLDVQSLFFLQLIS